MSLYLDTSCLWKLLVDEPESARVRDLVGNEPLIVVSSYAEFEDDLARIARQQVLSSAVYCRTADRLHLAAMEALGLRRLLTNDEQQATAARALGFGVLLPR